MVNKLKKLVVEEQGQGMTEYGIVLGVIAVGVIGILFTLKDHILSLFQGVERDLDANLNP